MKLNFYTALDMNMRKDLYRTILCNSVFSCKDGCFALQGDKFVSRESVNCKSLLQVVKHDASTIVSPVICASVDIYDGKLFSEFCKDYDKTLEEEIETFKRVKSKIDNLSDILEGRFVYRLKGHNCKRYYYLYNGELKNIPNAKSLQLYKDTVLYLTESKVLRDIHESYMRTLTQFSKQVSLEDFFLNCFKHIMYPGVHVNAEYLSNNYTVKQVTFSKAKDNLTDNPFDFIKAEVSISLPFNKCKSYVQEVKKEILQEVIDKVKKQKLFINSKLPIKCFEVSDMVITRDCRLIVIFEFKKELFKALLY